jgi:hypothetical protein
MSLPLVTFIVSTGAFLAALIGIYLKTENE